MQRWLHRLRDDEGVGIVLVLAIGVFVLALVAVAIGMAQNSLSMSRQRTNFEKSLAAAETGVDETLGRLQGAYDQFGTDYPVPNTTSAECSAPPVTSPADFPTAEAERTWATTQLLNLANTNPGCIRETSSGQYIVLKPQTPVVDGRYPGFGRVYSLGWSPGRGKPEESSRLVKAEYVFLPYAPKNAILTSGDLELESSTKVTTATGPGYSPTSAGVHSNGVITTLGNPEVYGQVTSTGTSTASSDRFYANEGGSVAFSVTQPVPRVSARSFYVNAPNSDAVAVSSRWYDLCLDGTVRAWSQGGPCTGTVNGSQASIGWSYDPATHTWTATRNTISGVFFAHEADVTVGTGNAVIPNISVIASSANPTTCSAKQFGNISWNHFDMAAPAFKNLFLLADADVETLSNFSAGDNGEDGSAVVSGMFVAGDQISMQTSSQGAVGSVIAADRCTTSPLVTRNVVKNPAVYFDPEGDSPFSDVITTTLWLEYPVE